MKLLYMPHEYSQQRQRERKAHIYPVLMAMEATYYKKLNHHVAWRSDGTLTGHDYIWYDRVIHKPEGLPFLDLPKPDRHLTNAMQYAYNNGNFKYTPGTYIQAASSCWWGKCTFCVEKDKPYIVREVADVIDEIKECKSLGYREIFDDSGTFPIGGWLDEFLDKFRRVEGIYLGCNLRLGDWDYSNMFSSGFRMVLFGVESANQSTLDKINKGVKVEDIKYIKKAAESGLEPHIAVMFGYPWETDSDSINTLRLVHYLLKKGHAKTAQASFYTTRETANESQRRYVRRIYDVAWSPRFWLNKIKDIKDKDDLKYLWRAIKKGISRD